MHVEEHPLILGVDNFVEDLPALAQVFGHEVVEHLHQPSQDFDRLFRVLKPGGWLAIMTKWVSRIPSFTASRYVRDMTHVCLYSPETFNWIAHRWNSPVDFPKTDIALFRKG